MSILPVVSKVFELLLKNQIVEHFKNNLIFSGSQINLSLVEILFLPLLSQSKNVYTVLTQSIILLLVLLKSQKHLTLHLTA